MIEENYCSFETAKLLTEKGFEGKCHNSTQETTTHYSDEWNSSFIETTDIPTLQMAMKWLREKHDILLIVDYDYECTGTPYCYKIYRLGEYGKPERVAVKGVSYDKYDNPTTHIVGWRDYERGYKDYGTYEDACEAGIKYCLNLI